MGYSAQSTNFFQESEISGSEGALSLAGWGSQTWKIKKPVQGTGSHYSVSNQLF